MKVATRSFSAKGEEKRKRRKGLGSGRGLGFIICGQRNKYPSDRTLSKLDAEKVGNLDRFFTLGAQGKLNAKTITIRTMAASRSCGAREDPARTIREITRVRFV